MAIKLSLLDQSPIFPGETSSDALQRTVQLAKQAEALGYHRFWVSEHHDSDLVAGSSPEVLIAYLLAHTQRIRIGSGGVMLQHYSPYKVAENFNVLASLAPGRIDLGIGRAPGGLPLSTQALQQGAAGESSDLTEKIRELEKFLTHSLEEDHPLYGLRATPIPASPADIYILGTSVASAEIAAELGLPYVFSLFINTDEATAELAINTYRTRFRPFRGTVPQPILALSVITAETDEEAEELARGIQLARVHLANGRTFTLNTVEQAEEFGKQSKQAYMVEVREAEIVKGSKETVRAWLLEAEKKFGVSEFIVTSAVKDFQKRLDSFALLQAAIADEPAEQSAV
ncbi:LLM class flavin-dependent oxidoreductase [Brevibacillus ruminantium]|uniref:LLM class flavin-dependent oxidoreductase n=1 Tax=Brevibacillus ruminantium TaxID=2950604 RepID=A0ABY4WN93_9BACL|nr:LLM class flavin-dependent oxidoreductase [Brevibacillus ruminantium]USG66874.1 LLM class flavin-dependent oxidoreductase [Brevibacillus ruminantium]